jgi:hypothetical protein
VAKSALAESVRVEIASDTLETTDSYEVYELIRDAGFTFVTNGFAPKIIQLSGLLTKAQKTDPKIGTALAYAHFATGAFYDALGFAGRALAHPDLDAGSRDVIEEIRDACECHLGRLPLPGSHFSFGIWLEAE